MRHISLLTAVTILALCASSCHHSTQKYNEGSVVCYADEGFKSFMEQEVQVFEYEYPNCTVLTKYTSEVNVINALLKDECTLGVVSRPLTEPQINQIKKNNRKIVRQEPIAVDALALIVNKENPVNLLTMSDIKDLFSGSISSWKQLAWNDTVPLKIVFDREGSASVSYIEDNFLPKNSKFPANVYAQKSTQEVLDFVAKDRGAIGILSVSWLGDKLERVQRDLSQKNIDSSKVAALSDENADPTLIEFTDKVHVLKVRRDDQVNGFAPYQAYINSGEYPLVRKIYLVSTASENSVGKSFYTFVTSFVGQKIILLTGIMPYHVHPKVVELGS